MEKEEDKGQPAKGDEGEEKPEAAEPAEPAKPADEAKKQEAPQPVEEEASRQPQQESPREPQHEQVPEEPAEAEPVPPLATADEETPARGNAHLRRASLSRQSKLRSSSFRRTSVSGAHAPAVSEAAGSDTPPLPDDAPEVFRKQSVRLEEVEKEDKQLKKELEEVDRRWKKAEEALEVLREENGDLKLLKERLSKAEERGQEVEDLVRFTLVY